MCIKRTGGSNSADFDGGFSYIISRRKGRNLRTWHHILRLFAQLSQKKYIYIGVFSGGLVQYFVGRRVLVGLADKTAAC